MFNCNRKQGGVNDKMVTNYLVWIVIILLAILVITFGIWNNTKEILQEVKEVKKHMGS